MKWISKIFSFNDNNIAMHKILDDFESRIENKFTRERLFREDFSRRLLEEHFNRIDSQLSKYNSLRIPVPYDRNGIVFLHTIDGHRLLIDLAEPFMAMHILEHGEWEGHVRDVFRRVLEPGGAYIDIGANIGVHAIFGASLVGPKGNVIAVEPHPRLNKLLRDNVEYNGLEKCVRTVQMAAGAVGGQSAKFEYFPQHPAMSSFRVSDRRLVDFRGAVEVIDVETITVDDLVSPDFAVDLVKIDVEGFEFAVLQGCEKLVRDNPDCCFLIEYIPDLIKSLFPNENHLNIIDFFEKRKFLLFTTDSSSAVKPQLVDYNKFSDDFCGDLLFVPSHSRHLSKIQM